MMKGTNAFDFPSNEKINVKKVLIFDKDNSIANSLKSIFCKDDCSVLMTSKEEEVMFLIKKNKFDLAIIEMSPHTNGIKLLKKIKVESGSTSVILLVTDTGTEKIVAGIKNGADDFIEKPVNILSARRKITKCLQSKERDDDQQGIYQEFYYYGKSDAMLYNRKIINKISQVETNVMITGESGIGKSLLAKEIHRISDRKDKPFFVIDCASIPTELLESELFGHERGSFTGAVVQKKGKFEVVEDGILFLDEIGLMPLKLQVKLLSVLQEREFFRVGGLNPIKLKARIITATNEDLEEKICLGTFREDLYYRINVVQINLPPLRDRPDDLDEIITIFLNKISKKLGVIPPIIDREVIELFKKYSWPGNIRELENVLEHCIVLCEKNIIRLENLPNKIVSVLEESVDKTIFDSRSKFSVEKNKIIEALVECRGHRQKTADLLGISRRNLQYKLNEHNLKEIRF